MRTLVVYSHPREDSLAGSLRQTVVDELTARKVDHRVHDLYGDGFNPVLSEWERRQHMAAPEIRTSVDPLLKRYTDDLLWCDSIIFVYPTWWSGQPTMLKGWLDRVLINGVAWTFPAGATRLHANLRNVRRMAIVTSYGSPKLANMVQGESGKKVIFRGMRVLCNVLCRTHWVALYNVDNAAERKIETFRRRVRRTVARFA